MEFGARQTSAKPIQNFVNPREGVVREPGTIMALGSLFDALTDVVKDSNQKKVNAVLGDFTEKQLTAIQAVEQGKYNSRYARTIMRQNLLEAVAAYPALREELLKTNSSIIGQGGMGGIITDGTIEENRLERMKDQLTTQGFIPPGASDNQVRAAISDFMTMAEAKRRYDTAMETLDLELKTMSVDDRRSDQAVRRRTEISERFLIESAPAQLQELDTFANRILEDPNLTPAQRLQAIEQHRAELVASTAPYIAGLDSTKANALQAAFEARYAIYKKVAEGEYSMNEGQNRLRNTQTAIQNRLLENEAFAMAYGMSQILPNTPLTSLEVDLARIAQNMIDNLSDETNNAVPFYNAPRDSSVYRKYLDIITGADTSDPLQLSEQGRHYSSILQSISDYESLVERDPRSARRLVDWLASREFLQLVETHDGRGLRETAAEVLQRHYDQQVWGLIRDEFREKQVGTGETYLGEGGRMDVVEPADQQVGYRAVPDGVQFYPLDPENSWAVSTASSLNRNVRPVINTMVRASSHLQGRSDYQQMFTEMAETMLQSPPDAQSFNRDSGGGQLDWSDLRQSSLDVEPIAETEINNLVGTTTAASFNTGRTMTPAGMIIHHTGGRGGGDGNLTGLINDMGTRRVSAHFFVDRSGRVHQAVPDNQVAWHAGVRNNTGFNNSNTIGVEVIANDDSDITPVQIEATRRLIAAMADKYGFDPTSTVFGHGEVAPAHKQATEGQTIVHTLSSNNYDSIEEMQADADAGNLVPGQLFSLNGRILRYE